MPGNPIKLLVVDDSAFFRRAVIRMFRENTDIRVVDVACDGAMAIELIGKHRPDVVTLDVQMPVLDGLAALERIMKECPVPVIMLSSLTGKGGEKTLKALELGAVDFIDKTATGGPMELSGMLRELTQKIQVAARIDVAKLKGQPGKTFGAAETAPFSPHTAEAVLIGTSTGGPPALQKILCQLPANFPCPVLIVQHMPTGFTASLAERLNKLCRITVKEAADGERIAPGIAYIAPGGKHLKVRHGGSENFIRLDSLPEKSLHCPSVDELFISAAGVYGKNTVALVLTGMGRDGAAGVEAVKRAGGRVVVESEETAIVYGMPKAAAEAVTTDGVLPLQEIPAALLKMI